jgi:putative two-component system hydrogenase maturation factor HypX/HoxX
MRILLLTHAFNSLAQRLFVALREHGHAVSVEFDINDTVTEEAVAMFRPDLVVAPFLKRAIPESVWRTTICLVVHPGIRGDRGPSALDWAILEGEREWGVTVLQANAEMDAGDVCDSPSFPMRAASKSSLYRNEVAEAAERAMLSAVRRFSDGSLRPEPLDTSDPGVRGRLRPAVKQAERAIDWTADATEAVIRKINSGDGRPGVRDRLLGCPVWLYDAHADDRVTGDPGRVIGRREGAVCVGTADGAVWIGQARARDASRSTFKLPAAMVLGERLKGVPALPAHDAITWRDIRYEERGGVGALYFPFYNGAMSARQCERLRAAYAEARLRDTRVIVLFGGRDFWSNGMHLGVIEAADSPADESWRTINAIDDLVRDVITTDGHLTIAAMQGNAGAGGVFMALAADRVVARDGIVLNPHYKGMGNLYGSEYWTYLLPRRAGAERAAAVTQARLPMGVAEAARLGLIDESLGGTAAEFRTRVLERAEALASDPAFPQLLADKARRRAGDEAEKPLDAYRAEELERMRMNFYGFDPSYHVARSNFIRDVAKSRTPATIATHRRRTQGDIDG